MKHPDYSPLRAARRLVLLVVSVLLVLPIGIILWAARLDRVRAKAAHYFFWLTRVIIGVRVIVHGAPSTLRPLMIVANHSSYLDVFVIGSQLPVSFTPKREIRGWPVIGFLCVLADCVFVERRPGHMEEARAEMAARIAQGRVLCLFPEGTTTDGKNLKPFKSGFFSLAEQHALPIQPASLTYTHIGDMLMADRAREMVVWINDATFFGHFLHLLGLPGVTAELRWHAPLQRADFADRKALAKAAETMVVAGTVATFDAIRHVPEDVIDAD